MEEAAADAEVQRKAAQQARLECETLLAAAEKEQVEGRVAHEALLLEVLMRKIATNCNKLQQTTTNCNALQHTARHCSTLRHTASHCTTLHHTAPHCITLHHTHID